MNANDRVNWLIINHGQNENPSAVWTAIDAAALHTPLSRIDIIERLEALVALAGGARISLIGAVGMIEGGTLP